MSFLAAALAAALAVAAQAPVTTPIDAAGVTAHLTALQRIADRNGDTRAAGTRGDTQTADYLATQLRAAGWTVRLQDVAFPFSEVRGRPRLAGLRRGTDFRVLEYSGGATLRARIRPLDTEACTAAALGPVRKGEIAMVARGTCTFRTKARNAQRAGAAALIVVDRDGRTPVSGSLERPGIRIPVLAVTGEAAAGLARRTGPVAVRVDAVSEERRTRNVLAQAPGTTDGAKVVMAGAHLDSVPAGPGLNDDGSGLAALLEVAERLTGTPGVRIGFWGAEELGLYGSRTYVRRLSRARRRAIAAYVNLDMVGSPHPRAQVYDGNDRIERALRASFAGELRDTKLGGSSDHASFARAGIPVGGLFTGSSRRTDPCYHRACDDLGNVDAAMAARMAETTRLALGRLAG